MNYNEIEYGKIIKHFGMNAQKMKSIEEFAELTELIARDLMEIPISKDRIIEEIADAYIMIHQLILIYGHKSVEDAVDKKIKRIKEVVEGEISYEELRKSESMEGR